MFKHLVIIVTNDNKRNNEQELLLLNKSGKCTLHVQGKLASRPATSLTSSLSFTDTRRVESEAVTDARDPLRPSSRFSLLASVSITAALFMGTRRQARQPGTQHHAPAGRRQRDAAPHSQHRLRTAGPEVAGRGLGRSRLRRRRRRRRLQRAL